MYLIIPLSLVVAACIGITVIVWRKRSYLRKLMPESHEAGATIFHDFAPELIDWFKAIPWRQYVQHVFVEIEKLLRRIRVFMSSIDTVSDTVIRKVRHVHQETARQHEEIVARREEEEAAKEEEPDEIDMSDPEQLKQEEQRLIVAIAQSPKEVQLYRQLARVYTRLENHADAVESLEAAAKLDPGNKAIAQQLERARRRMQKTAATEML